MAIMVLDSAMPEMRHSQSRSAVQDYSGPEPVREHRKVLVPEAVVPPNIRVVNGRGYVSVSSTPVDITGGTL